jgi:hypothetical protein
MAPCVSTSFGHVYIPQLGLIPKTFEIRRPFNTTTGSYRIMERPERPTEYKPYKVVHDAYEVSVIFDCGCHYFVELDEQGELIDDIPLTTCWCVEDRYRATFYPEDLRLTDAEKKYNRERCRHAKEIITEYYERVLRKKTGKTN